MGWWDITSAEETEIPKVPHQDHIDNFSRLQGVVYKELVLQEKTINAEFYKGERIVYQEHQAAPGSKRSSNLQKCTNADVRLRTPDDGQKGCPKHVES